ncbi:MAG: single-stranded DNA-binding protein [Melioribacteraceae bacterium]|nr:single-stranded DNA-binding protein [Candidatus Pacearchaeota archaeon]MCF8356674.1 single-stranded DNA-binding protein [Melioribacteraceae bacterium]
MSSCKNLVLLIGHVGSDPEDLNDNVVSVKFHLFTNKSFFSTKKNQFIQTSERHLIKAWKQDAEYARNNIMKGDYVFVMGELHYHIVNVENRKIVNTEIIANQVIKLNKKEASMELKLFDAMEENEKLKNILKDNNINLIEED